MKKRKACKLRALIFDLDDTLYPERAYVMSGFQAVSAWAEEHLGVPKDQGFDELCRLFESGVRGNIFDCWLEKHGFDPNTWVPKMVQVYRAHNPSIAPYPEVPALLQRLRLRYRIGLVTDGYLEVQQRKLAVLGLGLYFDAVVFSDEFGREAWKPSTRPFEIVLKKLGVTGPESVYIADNPQKDFIGARQTGMWTVRVRRPDGLYSHIDPPVPDYAPDYSIRDLTVLDQVLCTIGGEK